MFEQLLSITEIELSDLAFPFDKPLEEILQGEASEAHLIDDYVL